MNTTTLRAAAALALLPAAGHAAARQAQSATPADPAPTPSPVAPTPLPTVPPVPASSALDGYSLPAGPGEPTVRSAVPGGPAIPTIAPPPRRIPAPSPSLSPSVRPSPSPKPSPTTPSPRPTPTAVAPSPPAPVAADVPDVAAPAAAPAPSVSPAPANPSPARTGWGIPWPAVLGIAAATASVLVLFGLTRRRRRGSAAEKASAAGASPVAPSTAPSPAVLPPAPRARLAVDLSPVRGGLTLISMVFEGEVLVRNDGTVPAADVRVEATLLPARSEQDAELGALFARPIARPAAPPFALAPGEERRVRVVAALPLAGVEPLVAGGRPMLVPVLAVNVTYAAGPDAGEGQGAASWIVGVARPGSAKLAPFWVDVPRMHDALAARPHALAVTR